MKEEILLAKRILKDPKLTELVSRKFNANIDRQNEGRMVVGGAEVRDLIDAALNNKRK